MKQPGDCANMAELRVVIDEIDARLVDLLALRTRCIDRAAMLKAAERLPARIESRIEAVIANVRARSNAQALDPDLSEGIWRQLIEWSIAREEAVLRSQG